MTSIISAASAALPHRRLTVWQRNRADRAAPTVDAASSVNAIVVVTPQMPATPQSSRSHIVGNGAKVEDDGAFEDGAIAERAVSYRERCSRRRGRSCREHCNCWERYSRRRHHSRWEHRNRKDAATFENDAARLSAESANNREECDGRRPISGNNPTFTELVRHKAK